MKKIFAKFGKAIIVGVVAVILVTISIDAVDNYDNVSESLIGRLVLGGSDSVCPEDMVYILTEEDGFCIDKYEASPAENCVYLNVTSQINTQENLDDANCYPASIPQTLPWRFISQSQAALACAKAGKRLSTNEEWYLASLGTPDLAFNWTESDCQVNNNWDDQPGLTGSGDSCVSAAGAYDMIGNVWEWTKGEIREGKYEREKLPEDGFIISVDSQGIPLATDQVNPNENFNEDYLWIKHDSVRGIARGGYWGNKAEGGIYSMYLVSVPSFAGAGIGFRCAK